MMTETSTKADFLIINKHKALLYNAELLKEFDQQANHTDFVFIVELLDMKYAAVSADIIALNEHLESLHNELYLNSIKVQGATGIDNSEQIKHDIQIATASFNPLMAERSTLEIMRKARSQHFNLADLYPDAANNDDLQARYEMKGEPIELNHSAQQYFLIDNLYSILHLIDTDFIKANIEYLNNHKTFEEYNDHDKKRISSLLNILADIKRHFPMPEEFKSKLN